MSRIPSPFPSAFAGSTWSIPGVLARGALLLALPAQPAQGSLRTSDRLRWYR